MTTFLDKLARSDEGDVYQALVTATGEGASFHQLFARAFLAKVFKQCKRRPFDPVDPLHPLRRVMRGRWTFLSFFRDYPMPNAEEKANLLEHFVDAFQLVAFFYDFEQQEYRPTFLSCLARTARSLGRPGSGRGVATVGVRTRPRLLLRTFFG